MYVGITEFRSGYVGKLYTPHLCMCRTNVHFTLQKFVFWKIVMNRHWYNDDSVSGLCGVCTAEYRVPLNILTTNLHTQRQLLRKLPLVHTPNSPNIQFDNRTNVTHTRHTVDSQPYTHLTRIIYGWSPIHGDTTQLS